MDVIDTLVVARGWRCPFLRAVMCTCGWWLASLVAPDGVWAQTPSCRPLWPMGPDVRVELRDTSEVRGEFLCVQSDSLLLRDAVRRWGTGNYTVLGQRVAFDRNEVRAVFERRGTHWARGLALGAGIGTVAGFGWGATQRKPGFIAVGAFVGLVVGMFVGDATDRWVRVPGW